MKMCNQNLKKNIAGRIPETTLRGNPSNYSANAIQLLIRQNVHPLIHDYLETNKKTSINFYKLFDNTKAYKSQQKMLSANTV